MYNGTVVGTTGALAALPFTGFSVIWAVIAGFALLMAAGALWRIVPRRQA